ncbi:hypothetical protein PCANC_02553 [Puccinia coronata f. sp. avenae]|uniref:No apical meristem-associated C-terminal domain-containing protein n=1 Tax=Puccinia coronata f. sp. avenae TaxID=200324 RepID=A0A2N5VYL6_9BASI|nr:hypothetical protein PCANC_02553 [Puccinia coronata f. sp. avenae]
MSLNTSLPAFLDPLLKDNQPEEDFEEEQTPTSKKKKNAEPKITRQRNYSDKEDIQLCELWLDVTQDPVSRWFTLQGAINKFSACVKQIEHRNQSGATNKDKLTYPLCLYSQTHRKAFAHIACYKILVNAPKWNEYITNLQNKSASQKRKRQDTTTTIADLSEPPSDVLSTTESSTGQMERLSGQKKSKNDQQQTDAWQQALAKSQKEMVEQRRLQNELLSSQTKAMNSIAKDSRSMVEDSFMSKDYSHMDERTQRYYELKKNKYFEQYGIN